MPIGRRIVVYSFQDQNLRVINPVDSVSGILRCTLIQAHEIRDTDAVIVHQNEWHWRGTVPLATTSTPPLPKPEATTEVVDLIESD